MAERILPGLLQKALMQATDLHAHTRADKSGDVWQLTALGWIKTGHLTNAQDREDFLVGKLTQEDR